MFAIVKTGGKQYRAEKDLKLVVEKLDGEVGSTVELGEVLMAGDAAKSVIGAPFIAGAKVQAEIIGQGKGDKVIIFKKKRRHNYRRKNGHRQPLTVLKVTNIIVP